MFSDVFLTDIFGEYNNRTSREMCVKKFKQFGWKYFEPKNLSNFFWYQLNPTLDSVILNVTTKNAGEITPRNKKRNAELN